MGDPGFSPRLVRALQITAMLSALGVLTWFFFGHHLQIVRSNNPDTFSRSAIGHGAFKELLEKYGYTVHVSRQDTAAKVRNAGLLVIAEPLLDTEESRDSFKEMLDRAQSVLVVLPKRQGGPKRSTDGFITEHELVALDRAQATLELMLGTGDVTRLASASEWNAGQFENEPRLFEPQLITKADAGAPWIAAAEGEFLIAASTESGGGLYILSDPDLIANHGLDEPGNATLLLELMATIVAGDGGIIIDETLHGHESGRSLGALLTEWPLVLASIQLLLLGLILLWSSMMRFGSPVASNLTLARGKNTMLDNTAELLHLGGHDARALERYVRMQLDEAAVLLRAPEHLGEWERIQWLETRARRRGVELDLKALYSKTQDATLNRTEPRQRRLITIARAIHQWKRELDHDA